MIIDDYLHENINKYLTLEAEDFNSRGQATIVLFYSDLLSFLNENISLDSIFDMNKINKILNKFFDNLLYLNKLNVDEVIGLIYIPLPIGEFLETGKIKTYNWEDTIRDDPDKDYKLFKNKLYDFNTRKPKWKWDWIRREYILETKKDDYDYYNDYDYDTSSTDWDEEVLVPFIMDNFESFVLDIVDDLKRIRKNFIREYKKIEESKYTERKSFKFFKEDIEIERGSKEVIAKVTGKESEIFTKIGKKLLEIEEAERKLKELKEEVKDNIRNEKIVDIFDQAEDKLKTRKIQTLSLILTISKDPAPRKTVAYKQVLDELLEMFPELVEKYNELVEKYTTITQLEPTVKATLFFKEAEENTGFLSKIKNWFVRVFDSWLKKYDMRLNRLQKKVENLKRGK